MGGTTQVGRRARGAGLVVLAALLAGSILAPVARAEAAPSAPVAPAAVNEPPAAADPLPPSGEPGAEGTATTEAAPVPERPPAASSDGSLTLAVGTASMTITPNGDQSQDLASISYCVTSASNVWIHILDADGTVVRLIEDGVSHPGGCGRYYDQSFSWNGLGNDGVLVPDGTYTAAMWATDATGNFAEASLEIAIETRVPGAMVSPANGTLLAEGTEFRFVPTEGFPVDLVGVSAAGCGAGSDEPEEDGTFVMVFENLLDCTDGTASVAVYALWTDQFGAVHGWNAPTFDVVVANPVRLALPPQYERYLYPALGETASFEFCQSEWAMADVEVLDDAGEVVALPAEGWGGPGAPGNLRNCGAGGWGWTTVTRVPWDLRGFDGEIVPAGDYHFRVRVEDSDHNTATLTSETKVHVDPRLPGAMTAPVEGSALSGTIEARFVPTAGFDLAYVGLSIGGSVSCSASSEEPEEDGTFTVSLDTETCGEGSAPASMYTYWTDPLGGGHSWSTPPVTVTVTVGRPLVLALPWQYAVEQHVYPSIGETAVLAWCQSEYADVTAEIVDSEGAVAATLDVGLSYGERGNIERCGNGGWGWRTVNELRWNGRDDNGELVPDGAYTWRIEATNAGGSTATIANDHAIHIRSGAPGSFALPEPEAVLTGDVPVSFTPTPGWPDATVGLGLAGCSITLTPGPDSTHTGLVDTTECEDGSQSLSGGVSWTDPGGGSHYWPGPVVPVTVRNPIVTAVTVTLSDAQYVYPEAIEKATLRYCLSEAGLADVEVLDGSGAVVARPAEGLWGAGARWKLRTCGASGRGWTTFETVEWDGTGLDGETVPDGTYHWRITATDVDATTSTSTSDDELIVDSRSPGAVVSPETGARLRNTMFFTFQPSGDLSIAQIDSCFTWTCRSTYNASPGGTWYTTAQSDEFSSGFTTLRPAVHVQDPENQYHRFELDPISIEILPPARPRPSTGLTYVALGDSYSSGEGVGPFRTGTDNNDGTGCHRSGTGSFASQLKAAHPTLAPGTVKFAACSGAVVDSFLNPNTDNPGEPAQLTQLEGTNVDLLSFSVGGNDVGFARILKDCIDTPLGWSSNCPTQDSGNGQTINERAISDVLALGPKLRLLYHEILERTTYSTPNKVVVVGYPQIFSNDSGGGCSRPAKQEDGTHASKLTWGLTASEVTWLANMTKSLNNMIEYEALRAGFLFADVEHALDGHDACSSDPWVHGVTLKTHYLRAFAQQVDPLSQWSFHPTRAGQGAIANVVAGVLASNGASTGRRDADRLATTIKPNQRITDSVTVASGQRSLTVTTRWPGSDVVTRLVSPSGVQHDRGTVDAAVDHTNTDTRETYTVADPEPGEWTIELIGANVKPGGEPVTVDSFQLAASELKPVVAIAADDDRGVAPLPVAFDGSGTTSPNGDISSYAWDFGDGDTASGAAPSHTFTEPGTYEVELTVTDEAGISATASRTITVSEVNEAPTVQMTYQTIDPATGEVGFLADASDVDGEVVEYRWDLDGDGTADRVGAPATIRWSLGDAPAVGAARVTVVDDAGATTTVVGKRIAATPRAAEVRVGVADFDGDGATDPAVFRASTGAWYIEGQDPAYFGLAGDIPVPCDFDGDGADDLAVFRPSSGGWYIDGREPAFYGLPGDVPVPADFDGDGACDLAVWRPSDGGWYRQGAETQFHGLASDIPFATDWDGDGAADLTVFRPEVGGWYTQGSGATYHGLPGDTPIAGDFDGDGRFDRTVFRPDSGAWITEGRPAVYLGLGTDVPQPGDYDGDLITDRAVYRPNQGAWFIEGQDTRYLGGSDDRPLVLPPAVYDR
jgi:PKD repeat protein/flagellar hook assembly protein FlgD